LLLWSANFTPQGRPHRFIQLLVQRAKDFLTARARARRPSPDATPNDQPVSALCRALCQGRPPLRFLRFDLAQISAAICRSNPISIGQAAKGRMAGIEPAPCGKVMF